MDVQLVVIKGNPRGRTLSFGPGEYLVGRGPECHIRPDSEWVSRQHCLLSVALDRILLKDLGSTNGTLVNGQRLIGERELVHSDTIQVGPLVFQMRLPSQEAELEALKQTEVASGDATIDEDRPIPQLDAARVSSTVNSPHESTENSR